MPCSTACPAAIQPSMPPTNGRTRTNPFRSRICAARFADSSFGHAQ
jgi:hypothetical protein